MPFGKSFNFRRGLSMDDDQEGRRYLGFSRLYGVLQRRHLWTARAENVFCGPKEGIPFRPREKLTNLAENMRLVEVA
jgi:hypothetical protein